jgi:AraC-like DNA-binding protein
VASALGVSLRSLHVAFEPAGTTVTNYIRRRRLDECRAALLNDPSRPVTDIAFAWGFGSLSGFYRAFRAAFDATPGDLRAVVEKSSQY